MQDIYYFPNHINSESLYKNYIFKKFNKILLQPLIKLELSHNYLNQLKLLNLDINNLQKTCTKLLYDENENCIFGLKHNIDSLFADLETAVSNKIDNLSKLNNSNVNLFSNVETNFDNNKLDEYQDMNANILSGSQSDYKIEYFTMEFIKKIDPDFYFEINKYLRKDSTDECILNKKDDIFQSFLKKKYDLVKKEYIKNSFVNFKDIHKIKKHAANFKIIITFQPCITMIGFQDDLIKCKDFIIKLDSVKDDCNDFNSVFDIQLSNIKATIKCGDLLFQNVEALVNPCDQKLQPISDLGASIVKQAGDDVKKIMNDFRKKNITTKHSLVFVTPSGNLNHPIKHILHLVAVHNLVEAFLNIFEEANSLSVSSIAMPIISTGLTKLPLQLIAESFIKSINLFNNRNIKSYFLTHILLVDNDLDCTKIFINRCKYCMNIFEQSKTSEQYVPQRSSCDFTKNVESDEGQLLSKNLKPTNLDTYESPLNNTQNSKEDSFQGMINKFDILKPKLVTMSFPKMEEKKHLTSGHIYHDLFQSPLKSTVSSYNGFVNEANNCSVCNNALSYCIKRNCEHFFCSIECTLKSCLKCEKKLRGNIVKRSMLYDDPNKQPFKNLLKRKSDYSN